VNNILLKISSLVILLGVTCASAEMQKPSMATTLSVDEAVQIAVAANPQVLSAKAQYLSALHQIDQAYTPQDPEFNYSNNQSPNGLFHPYSISRGISASLQFPGKGWLQGDEARRTAEIAKLTYQAAVRDTRAGAETTYYQTLLDSASVDIAAENAASIGQVMEVARVAYTANQVTESDLISAQFQLSQASQTVWVDQVSEANDEAGLNQILGRKPQNPLELTSQMELEPLELSLDTIKEKALTMRQEILEAALSEKNNKTALKLAWMELLPDFTLSYAQTRYGLNSASPNPGIDTKDNTASIDFNIPVFFWFKQKEDIRSASDLLDAARQNQTSVELQTETSVVQLYRSTNLAYQTALLYRNFLVPLADKNFRVALVAYQSKHIDFTTLANTLQNVYSARITYLTSMNQFLAGRVALEQLMGGPLK
jgi:outer membrane protein, heavy metal efflux system